MTCGNINHSVGMQLGMIFAEATIWDRKPAT